MFKQYTLQESQISVAVFQPRMYSPIMLELIQNIQ